MRDFMKIINEHVDVDRQWIIDKYMAALLSGEHWDTMAMRRNDSGKLEGWQMGCDDIYSMASQWAEEIGMADREPEDIVDTEPFRQALRRWLEARYGQVIKKIEHLTAGDTIPAHRFMRVPEEWVVQARQNGSVQLGIYWTFDLEGSDDLGAIWGHEQQGEEILIHAMVPTSGVDWHYTVLANMDWHSGDYEHEVRVKAGAPLNVQWIQTVDDGSKIDMSGVKFTS